MTTSIVRSYIASDSSFSRQPADQPVHELKLQQVALLVVAREEGVMEAGLPVHARHEVAWTQRVRAPEGR